MKQDDGKLDEAIRDALKTPRSRRQKLMREADSKQMFAVGVLLMAILSAVFGLYNTEPERAFYRYSFLVYAGILMIGGGIYFDHANKLKSKAFDDADDELVSPKTGAPEPPDHDGGEGIRRVK
jgi:hypothetical protein